MSYADRIFKDNCREILTHGVWDTDQNVRPHWDDGTPAHTVKKFGIVNRYDLREEFPILTIRRTYFKTCIDELLWIWQQKSNNIHDLRGHIWDSWADENGSIGKAYGYQLAVKHQYPEGEMDQVDRVLYDLKHNPASRRILTNIYNFQDLHEMALYPCAYSMTFNVSGNTLNAILNQRSQDMLAANNWNVVQYAVLVHMMAQVSGLQAGELVHVIADCHIYDRHVPIIERLLEKDERPAPKFSIDTSVTDFYQFTRDSFSLEGYDPQPFEDKIPWPFKEGAMYAIVAVDEKWGIGRDNGLLFRLSADLKRFRSLTEGHTVLMGRKTLESLPGGRGLPRRRNIVLTGRRDFAAENCQIVHSPAEAVLAADEDTWVIGGESVYRAFLPLCSRVYVTRIAADGGADVFFPDLSVDPQWRLDRRGKI